MGKIEVLDCTLRDGAYIVDSKFGANAIRGIIHKLQDANIEMVECGWLKDKPHENGTSFYHVPQDLASYRQKREKDCLYLVMIDWDRYDDSVLPQNDGTYIDAVRIVFPHGKCKGGLEIAERIREKGYKIYLQAANTLGYSKEDLLELAVQINEFQPEGISIVDTFGAMYEEDLMEIAEVLDEALNPQIKLGFHSHNNQQMAFANCLSFVRYFSDRQRDIILDSSLCGMGRGAGNATTELITGYLNRKHHKNYNMDLILDAIDTYMTGFQENYSWGYSTPYYIAGTYCCHVNNIAYLLNNHRTTSKDMRNIIASLSTEERLKYDYDLLEEKYIENQSRFVDDERTIVSLKEAWKNKKILLIAPGKSALEKQENIKKYIADNELIIIAVNALLPGYEYDHLFLTNRMRYDYAKENHGTAFQNLQKIVLSNIKTEDSENECIIHFNRVIKRGWEHFDNAVICMLRLLNVLEAKEVIIAGFDGFKKKYNESYADPSLPTICGDVDYDLLNEEIKDMYQDFVKSVGDKMSITFLTESYFGR